MSESEREGGEMMVLFCGCNQRCSLWGGLICSCCTALNKHIYTHTHSRMNYPWITFSHSTRWLIINFSYSLLFSMAWFIRIWITFDVITHSHSCCCSRFQLILNWLIVSKLSSNGRFSRVRVVCGEWKIKRLNCRVIY